MEVKIEGANRTTKFESTTAEGEENTYQTSDGGIQVINNTGIELPHTGGIGTTIFYAVGGVLVLAAVVLLVTKKRMSSRG